MSKFVTYPAVTMLDNDHSLLIDDPNAGTNSITAENAGNTLLSKWAGFETFDEAVQNTIEHNQKFIDRDTAIRSETAELKKKIVTTFPAKEASGAVATFESEFEDAPLKSCIVQVEPVQDLHGYDSPWVAGGGKNKLLFKTEDLTASKYGMELSYNATTEVITVTGTETHGSAFSIATTYQYRLPKFVAGETYTISRTQVTGNLDEKIYFQITYRKLDGTSSALVLNRTASTTFTVPNDFDIVTNIFVGVFAGVSDVNNAFKLQLESGSTATDWTPYSNICPISGWTGCEVQRTGKNLIPADIEYVGKYGVDANGKIKNGVYYTVYFPIPKGTLLYHADTTQGVTQYTLIDEPLAVGVQTTGGVSLTNYKNRLIDNTAGHKYLMLMVWTSNDTAAIERIKSYGITFLYQDYIPGVYTEPKPSATYPITFPSEAGTVYGAYVDVINRELVVDRAIIELRGQWRGSSIAVGDNTVRVYYSSWLFTPAMLPNNKNNVINIYADKLQVFVPDYIVRNDVMGISENKNIFSNGFWVRVDKSLLNEATQQGIADWLAQNPITVCYKLAEPIHYPLTPTEIKTLLGTNNIWADTGDTAVEYLMSDVGWYVEKKLRAFQSILAGVEDSAVASKNYSANTYLIFNDDIYKTTKAITAGETIEEGVNVTKTTVAEQLLALAQA